VKHLLIQKIAQFFLNQTISKKRIKSEKKEAFFGDFSKRKAAIVRNIDSLGCMVDPRGRTVDPCGRPNQIRVNRKG
jgi:hypothetical protein